MTAFADPPVEEGKRVSFPVMETVRDFPSDLRDQVWLAVAQRPAVRDLTSFDELVRALRMRKVASLCRLADELVTYRLIPSSVRTKVYDAVHDPTTPCHLATVLAALSASNVGQLAAALRSTHPDLALELRMASPYVF